MAYTRKQVEDVFRQMEGLHVIVIGDVMVDSYLYGSVDRISPEAPVPVVAVTRRNVMLGGAANVARNLRKLGAVPLLCSVVGDDVHGKTLLSLMEGESLSTEGIVTGVSRPTTVKFRIIGNNMQMLRVDEETVADLDEAEENAVWEKFNRLLDAYPVASVIIQDYNKGVLTTSLIGKIIGKATENGISVSVDPKRNNFGSYRNIDLLKPNLKELREGVNADVTPDDLALLGDVVRQYQQEKNIRQMLVTLSDKGVFLSTQTPDGYSHTAIPSHKRTIADVSGAGDTVISVASLCTALNTDPKLNAAIANIAGGLVCEFVGIVAVEKEDLLRECLAKLTIAG